METSNDTEGVRSEACCHATARIEKIISAPLGTVTMHQNVSSVMAVLASFECRQRDRETRRDQRPLTGSEGHVHGGAELVLAMSGTGALALSGVLAEQVHPVLER